MFAQTDQLPAAGTQNDIGEALTLLTRALEIIDSLGLSAAIGARLDHVICSVTEHFAGMPDPLN